jgi:hypothetical protein
MQHAAVALAAHPLIDIDLTVLVQFGLFLVLFYATNKLLFQPYLALRERRKPMPSSPITRRSSRSHAAGPTKRAARSAPRA